MSRLMLLVGAVAISAVYFGSKAEDFMAALEKPAAPKEIEVQVAQAEPATLGPAGSEIIKATGNGHFIADFDVNGRKIRGLVDTGATFVAMNETTARQVGIGISGLKFKYAVNTANGKTEAAHVSLSRVELGSIRVRDVEAFVLRDKSLDNTILVGMSFLRKLESFKIEDGQLYLKN
ncbi:TIGR02281 family clan AA aspartic protease [Rhizobium sp. L1K21]|uniref:TIGR02281 family clan AA aspartic protease n=1 Tax=Rhizobium sp. L1K21 TaxID=2954933 RepID=UPI0020925D10|nr:TIGR02281 family clan AA aspartic protease [Rhizobium sp. L1K21]MCO6187282.1 TIGR02281 family clan AA aspartic protease [Rhizobium sp. L1K21]